MTLSEQTRNRIDGEHLIRCNTLADMAGWVDAHEAYANEFGHQAFCNFAGVQLWPVVYVKDASEYEWTRTLYGDKPLYKVAYQGFVLNVLEW